MVMMMVKAAALAAAAVIGGGTAAADTCPCPPPEVETISCVNGAVSWPAARCTDVPAQGGMERETLLCPAGETAISGGYRLLVLGASAAPPVTAAPYAPVGGHAAGYQYLWAAQQPPGQWRVYVTCERL
jgi:hypothetical protein